MGDESRTLRRLFRALEAADVEYVVGRKFEDLPDTVRGDVDIYAPPGDFATMLDVCSSLGFDDGNGSTVHNVAQMAVRAARHPREAAAIAIANPELVVRRGKGEPAYKHGYRNVKRYRGDLMLDLRNHLAYVSPSSGERVRAHPDVEAQFFDRRRRYGNDGFWVPARPDELVHVVAHCVFDKSGTFSTYYVDRCNDLFEVVSADPEADAALRDLLTDTFFGASALVYESIAEGRYDGLRRRLFQFRNY
ncbi:hypothetical protein [Halomarina litorea]|uniref:hypothetical protein n=1 Tax=Halomarina litorea TaxID=2961595 RepID=UPI0020C1C2FE|nr:hypothetical protein [Halomarina sp. BCD28]